MVFIKQINKIVTPIHCSENSLFGDFPVLFIARNHRLMIQGGEVDFSRFKFDFLEELAKPKSNGIHII